MATIDKSQEGAWSFDDAVAGAFTKIAQGHIPNYEKVIQKCVLIAKTKFPDDASIRILDVGSATGHTMDVFRKAGYTNVWGVEASSQMKQQSLYQDFVIVSETFPKDVELFNVVVANWTLHFVTEREQYIQDIYNGLAPGGVCVISDKMETTPYLVERYHDFKRSQGVTEEEIAKKALMIKGVLVPKPLDWYMATLKKVGFKTVELFDADWCFASIVCTK